MIRKLADAIRDAADELSGDIVHKSRPTPKVKAPRRRPSFKNKSQRSDYMKNYMQDYRGDKGKDYQKKPQALKDFQREQREKVKEKFNLKKD